MKLLMHLIEMSVSVFIDLSVSSSRCLLTQHGKNAQGEKRQGMRIICLSQFPIWRLGLDGLYTSWEVTDMIEEEKVENIEGFVAPRDYFIAAIEEGELAMRPFCACGNYLEEDYFCSRCRKQCLCTHIYCVNREVLDKVTAFISQSTSFGKFEATLLPEKRD